MRRSFVATMFALSLALAPAARLGPGRTAGTAAAHSRRPAAGRAAPAQPVAAKVGFATPAGILLVQIKPDKTADLRGGDGQAEGSPGEERRSRSASSRRPAGRSSSRQEPCRRQRALRHSRRAGREGRGLPSCFALMQKTMTPEQLRAPEMAGDVEAVRRRVRQQALSKLSLTPLAVQRLDVRRVAWRERTGRLVPVLFLCPRLDQNFRFSPA